MEFRLNVANIPFDLLHTLDSGQAFRWAQRGEWWYGVLPEGPVKVKKEDASLACITANEQMVPHSLHAYFRLEEDLQRVYSKIRKDEHITEAVQRYFGLRIMRQDVWECLVSFVVATNTNIPRIKLMIANLCEKFGEKSTFEGEQYALFPRPEVLAESSADDLAACGLGYRGRFVKSVAQTVNSGRVDLEELKLLDYERAMEVLIERVLGEKTLLGIGRKAADCILLFSCGKDAAFPIDVWMARVLAKYYPKLFNQGVGARLVSHLSKTQRLSDGAYESISSAMRDYFGEYAGYAQQYLFHDARKSKLE